MNKVQLEEWKRKQWELYLNHYNVGKEMMSEIPRGALFVDYNFRVNATGITFEDKYPKNLSLEAMNRQLVFEKQQLTFNAQACIIYAQFKEKQ